MYETKSVAEKPLPLTLNASSPARPLINVAKLAESKEDKPWDNKLAEIPAKASPVPPTVIPALPLLLILNLSTCRKERI